MDYENYPEDDDYYDGDYELEVYPSEMELDYAITLARIEDAIWDMEQVADRVTDLDSRFWDGYDEAMAFVKGIIYDFEGVPF